MHRQLGQETRLLKALAHKKRLEILDVLQSRELTAGQIQQMTGFPQANLSQHLRLLKLSGVIVAVREGKNIRYRLSHDNFLRLHRLLQDVTRPKRSSSRSVVKSRVQDPVCLMWVEPAAALYREIYKGANYFFCGGGCQHAFNRRPEKYAR